jgi:hypothetical protein
MSLVGLDTAEFIGLVVGFTLTLSIFSYAFGDNWLFRLAVHVFIGVAAGYAAVIAWHQFLWPNLVQPMTNWDGTWSSLVLLIIPLGLSVLMLAKISPRTSRAGNAVMAFLVGVGGATAIGGALLGTLIPQMMATMNLFENQANPLQSTGAWASFLNAFLILVGTLATLIYFQFGVRRSQAKDRATRPAWIEWLAGLGHLFIAVTFGALFAGVYLAALTALVERVGFLSSFVRELFRF